MTDDLAARLLAAIEEAEQNALLATQPHYWAAAAGWRPIVRAQVVGLDGETLFDSVTTADLRRCAADRKIVERHVKVTEMWNEDDERGLFDVDLCATCAYGRSCDHCFSREDLPLVAWPCPTLRDLAEAYGLSTGVDDECE